MTTPTRLIFAGTPDFAASSLQALIDKQSELNIDIVAVYTQPDRKAGRGQKLTASAVKQLALAHDIPVEQPLTFKKSSDDGMAARETLASYAPDVMVVAAYGLILPLGILNTPTHGCLNVHASLLPRWRGAAPIHRAILAGDTETGITIMQMDKGLDTGDMLYKVNCDITASDTSASLHDRLAVLGGEAIVSVLADLASYQAKAEKQDESLVTYAEKLAKAEGQIDWSQPASDIDRHIRGLQPWPVAFTKQLVEKKGKQIEDTIRVFTACRVDEKTAQAAGDIISISKSGVMVACGDGNIMCLEKLQWAGGKPLDAAQIYASQKLNVGDTFLGRLSAGDAS